MDIAAVLIYGWPGKEFSVGETYESLVWLSEDTPKPSLSDIEQLAPAYEQQLQIKQYTNALEYLLDTTSQSKTYKNQYSIVSYVNSGNAQWKKEAEAFVLWRDNLYAYGINIMNQVIGGQIAAPSIDDFLSNAPKIIWP